MAELQSMALNNISLSTRVSDAEQVKEFVDDSVQELSGKITKYKAGVGLKLEGETFSLSAKIPEKISELTDDLSVMAQIEEAQGTADEALLSAQAALENDVVLSGALTGWVENKGYLVPEDVAISYDSANKNILLASKGNVTSVDCADFVKDGMISDVYYDEGSHTLSILWNSDGESKMTEINLSGLVDVYTAGYGLKLENGEFSLSADIPEPVTVDSVLSATSENPVQNKVVTEALDARPTKAQIDEGWWSEWTVDQPSPLVVYRVVLDGGMWHIYAGDEPNDDSYAPIEDTEQDTLYFTGPSVDITATRHRVSAPVPTKPSDIGAQPAGNYLTQHQQLAPMYGGNGERMSNWTFSNSGEYTMVGPVQMSPSDPGSEWIYELHFGGITYPPEESFASEDLAKVATTQTYYGIVTAARTENPIIGYTLGDQDDKPLQPKGDYALSSDLSAKADISATIITTVYSDNPVFSDWSFNKGYEGWIVVNESNPSVDIYTL